MKQPISSRLRERQYRRDRRQGKVAEAPKSADTATLTPSAPPGGPIDKPKRKESRRKYLRHYVRWLWPYRFVLVGLLLLALVSTALDTVWPLAIKMIIDRALLGPGPAEHKFFLLNAMAGGVILLLVVKQALETLRSYRVAVLNAKVVYRLRHRLHQALLRLSFSSLADMKSGGIVSRLSGDVDSVSGLVQTALLSPSVAAIRVLMTLGILFALSWRLALAAMVILPPLGLTSFLWLRRVRPIYRSIRDDAGKIDGRVSETFGGIRVVRAFRREPREQRGYAVGHHTIIRKGLFAQRVELVLDGLWGLLIPSISLVVVWFGGRLILHSPPMAQIGDLFAFQIYVVMLLQPIYQIIASVSGTQKSLAAMERVFEVIEMPPDKPDAPDAVDAPRAVEQIRFEHVGFEYRPGVPVLRDFNLVVPGGSTVALVGPSGAGKSTLTDLVARFHDPSTGTISLNGMDLRNLRLRTYRSLLAVVQQETFLFDGSVLENISYGRRGATQESIIDAARRANAHEFIAQLPDGYDTVIGERGFKLSGGQKQRLSIARAILADPQILILDEATSNLDTESEQLIQQALNDLLKSRTTFVIAHRLSTVTRADIIVAMENGRMRESGTHDELIAQRGLYFAMVERQRQSFDGMSDSLAETSSADRFPGAV